MDDGELAWVLDGSSEIAVPLAMSTYTDQYGQQIHGEYLNGHSRERFATMCLCSLGCIGVGGVFREWREVRVDGLQGGSESGKGRWGAVRSFPHGAIATSLRFSNT